MVDGFVVENQMQGLALGRDVHFVLRSGPHVGNCRAAKIVRVWANQPPFTVQLTVFPDWLNDGFETGVVWVTSIVHGGELGQWHFYGECEQLVAPRG